MSNLPDESLFHAWLDGETDERTNREIEAWLREHPAMAREVEGWRQDKLRLQRAVNRTDIRYLSVNSDPTILRFRLRQRRIQRLTLAFALVMALGTGSFGGWQLKEHVQSRALPMEDAVQAYKLFGDRPQLASMDIRTSQPPMLENWLRRYFINGTLPPNLERYGFTLIGARLMASEQGASALVLYETAGGERIAWYIRHQATHLSKGARQSDGLVAQYWSDSHYNYAVVSPVSGENLPALREAISSEMG
ncbi:anti-sigma factor RsiW [Raoultella sp. BIGb0138]|uniref:anti-sigma factor family protein n=1 Tax=Raoultella sp. BIGb0138 TaxID=2485115 RepID=UPI0010526837|nr:anti-sigma factor [Raoultella sp. BIGb0138]TCW17638.1 anti-sigma factor RsiW [Raoultella sp. BIGb0138]